MAWENPTIHNVVGIAADFNHVDSAMDPFSCLTIIIAQEGRKDDPEIVEIFFGAQVSREQVERYARAINGARLDA